MTNYKNSKKLKSLEVWSRLSNIFHTIIEYTRESNYHRINFIIKTKFSMDTHIMAIENLHYPKIKIGITTVWIGKSVKKRKNFIEGIFFLTRT